MNKNTSSGVFASKEVRELRLAEINNLLNILQKNRDSLNKQFNELLFEAKILQETEQLDKYQKGEINLELKPIKEND